MTRIDLGDTVTLYLGDCLEVLPGLDAESVDSIVTDPPYGLGFMGKDWDHGVPGLHFWQEALRVAKPGAHLLAFGGTRTYHRLASAVEDAGWEIRDCIMWVYSTGFPKSLDVSKAIDKAAGAVREVTGQHAKAGAITGGRLHAGSNEAGVVTNIQHTAPATEAAKRWQGWGTALKPAHEPIVLARKPLVGTVAANVLAHGTGAINVDGCRIAASDGYTENAVTQGINTAQTSFEHRRERRTFEPSTSGRWPANLIHDGSGEVVRLFPQTGVSLGGRSGNAAAYGGGFKQEHYGDARPGFGDSGSAARFFKCCKKDSLSCLTCAKDSDTVVSNHQERIELWKRIAAHNAEKNGKTSKATSEFIARTVAIGTQNESLVLNVKSAGGLCDLCATSIAVALVGIKTSAFSNAELQAILACTTNCNAFTLIQSLASFAELWVNTDTIPTTNSLSLLFGSVRDAIASSTRQDTEARAEPRCAPARFAYIPKASKADRDEGCENIDMQQRDGGRKEGNPGGDNPRNRGVQKRNNFHPTVKPNDLMRYLCRLVTPPGGIIIDPFAGSGSTGKAAVAEGFRFVGIEKDPDYFEIARKRIESAMAQGRLAL